jgi:hypothetical protein
MQQLAIAVICAGFAASLLGYTMADALISQVAGKHNLSAEQWDTLQSEAA